MVQGVEAGLGHQAGVALQLAQLGDDGAQDRGGHAVASGLGEDLGVVGGHLDGAAADGQVAPDAAAVLGLGAQPGGEAGGGGTAGLLGRVPAERVRLEGVERLQGDAERVGHGEDLGGDGVHRRGVAVDQLGHRGVGQRGGGQHGAEAGLGPEVSLDVVAGQSGSPALQVGDEGVDAVGDGGAVALTDHQGPGAAVHDHAGFGHVGEDVDEGGDGASGADPPGDQFLVEAVLERDDPAV